MCNGYNGYKNYETWNIALWIDNDQGAQEFWAERAEHCDSIHDLAEEIKADYQENIPELTGAYADLLQAALDSVDWYEIAENFWQEYHDTEEED